MPPPPPHPNCVWLDFLQNWHEEARAKGTKAASTYLKAHRSLAAVAEPYAHPCETVRLAGIGPSIAKRLEKEYELWCQTHRQPFPVRRMYATHPASSERAPAARTTRTAASKTRRIRKEYVPEPRSGAHGILVGIYTKILDEGNDEAALGKTEVIARAQPYCDSDYSVPGGGSRASAPSSLAHRAGGSQYSQSRRSYITAWNAMKTLIDKGYVYRSGNPPLFYLSDQGRSVAKVLAETEGIAVQSESPPFDLAQSQPLTAQLDTQSLSTYASMPEPRPTSSPPHSIPVSSNAPTEPSIEPAIQGIPGSRSQLYLPPRKHYFERPERAPWKRTTSMQSGLSMDDGIDVDCESDGDMVVDLVQSSQEDVYVASPSRPATQSAGPVRISISLIDSSPIIQHTSYSSPLVVSSPLRAISHGGSSSPSPCAQPAANMSDTPRTPLACHVLPPDSYTIHMIMDHREVRARNASGTDVGRRVTFEDALQRRGIACELRALELSDVLWVAKPKPEYRGPAAQQWELLQEVVLDTVVERKRLDDLTSSIFDGRWHEQKVRVSLM